MRTSFFVKCQAAFNPLCIFYRFYIGSRYSFNTSFYSSKNRLFSICNFIFMFKTTINKLKNSICFDIFFHIYFLIVAPQLPQ